MQWDNVTTAIATSISAVVVVMLYLLNKPKIKFISAVPIHWFYFYAPDGIKPVQSKITINLKLQNNGGVKSEIDARFICESGIFESEQLSIEGKGGRLNTIMTLIGEGIIPEKGKTLNGILQIEPWGNRTFFIGKKYISVKLNIPYDLNSKNEIKNG